MSQNYGVAGLELPLATDTDKIRRILRAVLKERQWVRTECMAVVDSTTTQLGPELRFEPITDLSRQIIPLQWSPELASNSDERASTEQSMPTTLMNAAPAAEYPGYWDAHYFGLDQVQLFQEAHPEEQQAILQRASDGLMHEAYFIEKAGMGYMSRMALLAETTEERMLYTLFAADETAHFVQICPFLNGEPDAIANPFLQLLSEVAEVNDKALLLFVIQVILEGWGLTHYRFLSKGCLNPNLSQLFHGFLRDESRHHGTGVALFNQAHLSDASCTAIVEILVQFLRMVQVGPQGVLKAIAHVKGHLSRHQRLQIMTELHTETHSGTRLMLLRSLMKGNHGGAIAQRLEELDAFSPLPAHRCV
jgi:hypothetical protein